MNRASNPSLSPFGSNIEAFLTHGLDQWRWRLLAGRAVGLLGMPGPAEAPTLWGGNSGLVGPGPRERSLLDHLTQESNAGRQRRVPGPKVDAKRLTTRGPGPQGVI